MRLERLTFKISLLCIVYRRDIEEYLRISDGLGSHRVEHGDLVRTAMASSVHGIRPIVVLAFNAGTNQMMQHADVHDFTPNQPLARTPSLTHSLTHWPIQHHLTVMLTVSEVHDRSTHKAARLVEAAAKQSTAGSCGGHQARNGRQQPPW